MSKGELQFATQNYGSFIEMDVSPAGLYKGYQYISDVTFILGAPGRDENGNPYPWAMRPMYDEEVNHFRDTLVYWGATVNESWFDRVSNKTQVDWESVSNHLGWLHSGDVTAGEAYGGLYTDTGDPYPLLATSDIPDTWPMRVNPETGKEERTWPGAWAVVTDTAAPNYGEEIPGRHIGDQDIYMEFDDRLADRDEDHTQGYPLGIRVMVNGHSYGRSYAEDIAFFTVQIVNESWKGFPLDLNGDGEPDSVWVPYTHEDGTVTYKFYPKNFPGDPLAGFNYKGLYGGFYFDVDSYSRTASGSYSGRSNDDDMMAFDTTYNMAFIWDWDDNSNGATNLAYSALKLLDTPSAPYDIDLDGDGVTDIYRGEALGLTDWHWFDWYDRPGVLDDEKSGGSCGGNYAGAAGCPGAIDKEAIQFALMAGDTSYLNQPFRDWQWRGIPDNSSNPNASKYAAWYFHAASDGTLNPHFDSLEGLQQAYPDGLDCVFIMSAGPFDLAAGDTTYFSFAVIMADPPDNTQTMETPPDLAKNARMAQIMYDLHYQGFSPPEAPHVTALPEDGQVTLFWDSRAENSADIVTGIKDFEGYKIYKSTDGGQTWGDPLTDRIYDNDGNPVGWKPIAQFDLTKEEDEALYGKDYQGPDPVKPWINLGNDTGLKHKFVDKDVLNGVTYTYAVVAYDIGIDPNDPYTSDNGKWDIALESLENFKGNSDLLPQHVTVTPNARPSNAPKDWTVDREPGTIGTGVVRVIPTDPGAIVGNSNQYRIVVSADSAFVESQAPQHNNPYLVANPRYDVINLTTGDTVLVDMEIGTGTSFGDSWDGFQVYMENYPEAELDTLFWVGKNKAEAPSYSISITSNLPQGFKYAADYDIIWGEVDTAKLGSNSKVVPFTVYNRSYGEDLNGNGQLDAGEDLNNNGLLDNQRKVGVWISGGISGSSPDPAFPDFRSGARIYFRESAVPGYDSSKIVITWSVTVSWDTSSNASVRHYETGDTLRLLFKKPFVAGDAFLFDARSVSEMEPVTKEHLMQVKVVPNPYIVTAAWETDINHKSIHFTHLPDECVIKIFTVSGELVYTILHKDIFSGEAEWNLLTMNRQEVAPGLYVFSVEAPNYQTYVGKFAIIR